MYVERDLHGYRQHVVCIRGVPRGGRSGSPAISPGRRKAERHACLVRQRPLHRTSDWQRNILGRLVRRQQAAQRSHRCSRHPVPRLRPALARKTRARCQGPLRTIQPNSRTCASSDRARLHARALASRIRRRHAAHGLMSIAQITVHLVPGTTRTHEPQIDPCPRSARDAGSRTRYRCRPRCRSML